MTRHPKSCIDSSLNCILVGQPSWVRIPLVSNDLPAVGLSSTNDEAVIKISNDFFFAFVVCGQGSDLPWPESGRQQPAGEDLGRGNHKCVSWSHQTLVTVYRLPTNVLQLERRLWHREVVRDVVCSRAVSQRPSSLLWVVQR